MKITRLKKRSISVFVIIALLLSCVPLSIFASDDIPDIEVPFEPEIKITEVVDRREESIKHFKMPDGTYNAISYAGAVHRKNSDGEWIDINNDLSITTIGSKQLYTTNDSRVTFSRSYSSNEDIMTLRENGYVISMALLSNQNGDDMSMDMNATASLVTVNNSNYSRPESFDTIDEAIEINNKSSISYSNVMKYTDIEYVMNGNDIKENIIVKDRSDSYVYAFSLSLDGLIPLLDESGAIYLNDEESGDTKYVIPAPYMYDSNDEYSEEVYYELLHVEGDKYLLTVTADESWINDEERAFPVTVDPTVTSSSSIVDTYLHLSNPDTNYGSTNYMFISSTSIGILRMANPSIPPHSTINTATLNMHYYFTSATSGSMTVGAYQILETWKEATATYNSRPDISTTVASSTVLNASSTSTSSSPKPISINIKSIATKWYDGSATSWGIALKRTSGSISSGYFKSSEAGSYISMTVNYLLDIPEGVYGLQNVCYSNRWLCVDSTYNNGASGDDYMKNMYYSSTTNPVDTFDRTALFKITKSGTTGSYSIRLMTNNGLSMDTLLGSVKSVRASTPNTFIFEWKSSGFTIRQTGTSQYLSMISLTEPRVSTVALEDISSYSKWTLVRYSGEHQSGVDLIRGDNFVTQDIIRGSTCDVLVCGWSTYANTNNVQVTENSDTPHTGTFSWESLSRTLTITGNNIGTFKVNVSMTNNSTTVFSGTCRFNILPPEGTYFIKNRKTSKYITSEENSTSLSLTVEEATYSANSLQLWELSHIMGASGYVVLKSKYSNSYLGVDSNNTTLIKQYSGPSNYALLKMETTSSGNIKISSKNTDSDGYVICAPNSSASSNSQLVQNSYIDDNNYVDEWTLHLTKDVSLVALPEDYDRSSYFDDILSDLSTIGYTDTFDNHETISQGMNKDELLEIMAYSKITLIRTHGEVDSITVSDGKLKIEDLPGFGNHLSYSELIIYGSCLAAFGGDNSYNLVSRTVYAGCKTAIGFQNKVDSLACNIWCQKFFELYTNYYNDNEKNIGDICFETDSYVSGFACYEYQREGELITLRNFVIAT